MTSDPLLTTETVSIPTRHGDVAATVYRSERGSSGHAPVYVNFHGGGFIVRQPEQDDALCRYLAANAGVVVVNVDYDVAPEHPFPDPVEEAYDVVVWASEPGRPWDGKRLCVGGQSAGGALAAGVARIAFEEKGAAPAVALQVLHYPPLDLVTPPSTKRNVGTSVLSAPLMEMANAAYTPSPEARRDRLASPSWGHNADGLDGIAPAFVVICERDPLHDEGECYARKLDEAGALVEMIDLPVDHGYDLRDPFSVLTRRIYARIAEHVVAATS